MYSVKSYDIKAFITDSRIKLPRFQRKRTWNEISNFKLCISLFKDYPIGVSIVSVETINGRQIKYLLDGRQRKEALTLLNNDPENLYKWAIKFIKFKKSDSDEEVTDKFWDVIKEFLEEEDDITTTTAPVATLATASEEEEEIDGLDDISESDEQEQEQEQDMATALPSDGLDLLLKLILKTHHWSKKGSGFTLPFDFSKYVTSLPYLDRADGNNYTLSSRSLKSYISSYREFCNEKYYDDPDAYKDMESFWKFLTRGGSTIIPGKEAKMKEHLSRHWGAMLDRIELLQKLDEKLSTNEIGVIEVNDMKSYDYQKIFNLINTQGTDLKAVEILSAKPKWNVRLGNASPEFLNHVKNLYRIIGTNPEEYVKWDVPATFMKRIEPNFVYKNFNSSNQTDFEKELTSGFIALSGMYEGAVDKNAFDTLGSDSSIIWTTGVDAAISSIKNMFRVMASSNYFKYFQTWRNTLWNLTSEYATHNFFILSYLNWKKLNDPISGDSKTKKFQKDCFILFDRMIYENALGMWGSSGDSKIRSNIENIDSYFTPVPEDKWLELLNDVFDKNKLGEKDITFDNMKPLLYHFYCLNEQRGPEVAVNESFDVDHIIPQALFKNATAITAAELIQNNLLNLGILPKEVNVSKSNHRLIEITDSWAKQEIEKFEFVPNDIETYQKFSDVGNYQALFDLRRPIFIKAFKEKRTFLLNN